VLFVEPDFIEETWLSRTNSRNGQDVDLKRRYPKSEVIRTAPLYPVYEERILAADRWIHKHLPGRAHGGQKQYIQMRNALTWPPSEEAVLTLPRDVLEQIILEHLHNLFPP
jgi:hypothetical protein